MRRKDREVTDSEKILEMVDECEIVRLGLADGEFPYIVPVNFAWRLEAGQLALYVHGAKAGRKYELMKKNGRCSFEMDVPVAMECIEERGDVTMRYKCVMGSADIQFLEGEEKQYALDQIIMARHEETRNFPYQKSLVKATAVARLGVTELSAKANLCDGEPD